MSLQPNGAGLSDRDAGAHWNALIPQHVQHEAAFWSAGLAPGVTLNLPPMQPVSVRSGVLDAFGAAHPLRGKGVGDGHYLHPDGARLRLSGGCARLVQPSRAVVQAEPVFDRP